MSNFPFCKTQDKASLFLISAFEITLYLFMIASTCKILEGRVFLSFSWFNYSSIAVDSSL